MSKHRSITLVIVLLLILSLTSGPAAAHGSAAPHRATALGTAITYQGQLKDGSGNAISATCDFTFNLWDALSGGAQVGAPLDQTGVVVSGGLFTVQLDFGASAFSGSARWLEIAVKCASDSVFTTLTPRQPLTAAPYSLYSLNSDQLDGLHAAAFQQHYASVVVVAKSGGDFSTISAALASITSASAANPYLVYVAPGVYTEQVSMKPYVDIQGSGEQATRISFHGSASDNASTVNGASNAELRFLTVENTGGYSNGSAIYNSSASPRLTHLTITASNATLNIGVKNISASPVMTDLTISMSVAGANTNVGVANISSNPVITNSSITITAGNVTYGVSNSVSSPLMNNVTVQVSGTGTNLAVDNEGASSPTMTNVVATASGGFGNYGIYANSTLPVTLTNVTATATGSSNNYGLYAGGSGALTLIDVIAGASGGAETYGIYLIGAGLSMLGGSASASGGGNAIGFYNRASSPVTLSGVTVIGSGGSGTNYGIYNYFNSLSVNNTVISASDGTASYGIFSYAQTTTYTVKVTNSQITGTTASVYSMTTFWNNYLGSTQLVGGGVAGSNGHNTCVGAYNANFIALNASCQ
jgi:hypothetical protein